jgi:uncharacterized damage-inducible protein DinB
MRSSRQAPLLTDGAGVKVSDPRELLVGYLDWYRDTVLRKLTGLSDDQLRAPVEPFGWSPLGMVKHLGWVERRWLRWGFAAEDVEPFPAGGDATELSVTSEYNVTDEESVEGVLAAYRREIERAREVIAGAALTDVARLGGRFTAPEQAPPLARILFHLLQEYARHAGHIDIARELIDGTVGE